MLKTLYIVGIILFLVSCGEKPIELENTQDFHSGVIFSGENTVPELSFSGNIFSGNILEPQEIINPGKYDFETDNSYQKFVNNEISFTQKSYIPEDLEKISGEFIIDTKGNQTLRSEVVKNLHLLSKEFYNHFGEKLVVVSAYRSYEYQVGIKNRGCSDLYCAKAGYSEHQSGLAFDLFEATSQDEFLGKAHLKKYYEWLSENAHLYGFHNTYQKGKIIDGYAIEPWHWRYLGVDFATELKNQGKTFAEFVKEK